MSNDWNSSATMGYSPQNTRPTLPKPSHPTVPRRHTARVRERDDGTWKAGTLGAQQIRTQVTQTQHAVVSPVFPPKAAPTPPRLLLIGLTPPPPPWGRRRPTRTSSSRASSRRSAKPSGTTKCSGLRPLSPFLIFSMAVPFRCESPLRVM